MDVFVKKDAVDVIKALVDFNLTYLKYWCLILLKKNLKIASQRDSISADQVHDFRL